MLTRRPAWILVIAVSASICGGCDDSSADSTDAGPFIPSASSFDGFHQWTSANATAADDAGDGLHGVGPLRVYINQTPPHGSKSFPVGTIIVKETEQADVVARAAFAMVKLGWDYNSGGAVGWEWFSLQENADGSVIVLWDVSPLSNDTYANQPIGDCNSCHEKASANDYVWDTPLQLTRF